MAVKTITNLKPDIRNANKGTVRGRGMVEASLREVGAGRSIVADKDGRVIAGNKTLEAAIDIGLPIEVVHTDGTKLIVVQRDDLDLSDDTGPARKLAYYDNRASEVGLEWDVEQLLADAQSGLDLSGLFSQSELDEMLAELTPATENAGEIDNIPSQWAIMIECNSEAEQSELLRRFTDEGIQCKALIS